MVRMSLHGLFTESMNDGDLGQSFFLNE